MSDLPALLTYFSEDYLLAARDAVVAGFHSEQAHDDADAYVKADDALLAWAKGDPPRERAVLKEFAEDAIGGGAQAGADDPDAIANVGPETAEGGEIIALYWALGPYTWRERFGKALARARRDRAAGKGRRK